jgi:hypothetical protein
LVDYLVERGYAVAGSANSIFWPLELAFTNVPILIDVASGIVGTPQHTIAAGLSIGGIISAGLVQTFPGSLAGALPMGGNLAGAVSNHNRELDIAFVVKTLLAPGSDLEIVGITDSQRNLDRAMAALEEAQATPTGRARLAMAAAVGNIPGWHDPATPEPAASDFEARQRNQFALFEAVGFLVFFLARKQVEIQARGNPSWNTGVDYRELLDRSINGDEVKALYDDAGLDLDDDLERLAVEPRIEADPSSVAYLERHIVFDGDLHGVPVLTMHTDGDGLVIPDHTRAYADVVEHAGQSDLLRQVYVHRGGHCTFTFAEIDVALDALVARIENGSWPDLRPATLDGAAGALGEAASMNVITGDPGDPGFMTFQPQPFGRRYDIRDVRSG